MSVVTFPVHSLPDGGAKGFDAGWFAIRRGERVFAYLDRCPHFGRTTLAWKTDAYLTADRSHIRCAGHNALFDVETGICVGGPCLGEHLVPLPIHVARGLVSVETDACGDTENTLGETK